MSHNSDIIDFECELGNVFDDIGHAVGSVAKGVVKGAESIGKSTIGKMLFPVLALNTDPKLMSVRDAAFSKIPGYGQLLPYAKAAEKAVGLGKGQSVSLSGLAKTIPLNNIPGASELVAQVVKSKGSNIHDLMAVAAKSGKNDIAKAIVVAIANHTKPARKLIKKSIIKTPNASIEMNKVLSAVVSNQKTTANKLAKYQRLLAQALAKRNHNEANASHADHIDLARLSKKTNDALSSINNKIQNASIVPNRYINLMGGQGLVNLIKENA